MTRSEQSIVNTAVIDGSYTPQSALRRSMADGLVAKGFLVLVDGVYYVTRKAR